MIECLVCRDKGVNERLCGVQICRTPFFGCEGHEQINGVSRPLGYTVARLRNFGWDRAVHTRERLRRLLMSERNGLDLLFKERVR